MSPTFQEKPFIFVTRPRENCGVPPRSRFATKLPRMWRGTDKGTAAFSTALAVSFVISCSLCLRKIRSRYPGLSYRIVPAALAGSLSPLMRSGCSAVRAARQRHTLSPRLTRHPAPCLLEAYGAASSADELLLRIWADGRIRTPETEPTSWAATADRNVPPL